MNTETEAALETLDDLKREMTKMIDVEIERRKERVSQQRDEVSKALIADQELAQNSRNNIELDKAMSCYYEVLNYEADTIAKHIKLIVVHAV